MSLSPCIASEHSSCCNDIGSFPVLGGIDQLTLLVEGLRGRLEELARAPDIAEDCCRSSLPRRLSVEEPHTGSYALFRRLLLL